MNPLPEDPLEPATKRQEFVAGIGFFLAGIAVLAFATWLTGNAYSNGRLKTLPVICILGGVIFIGIGFLDAAFAVLRKKGRRRPQLLGSVALYLVGSFMIVLPPWMTIDSILKGEKTDLKVLWLVSLGLLAVRLAWIRRKKTKPQHDAGGR